jgi:hypothetical protein
MSEPGWNPTSGIGSESEFESSADSPQGLIAGPRPPGGGFPRVDWGTGADAPVAPRSPAGDDAEGEPDGLEDSLDEEDREGDQADGEGPAPDEAEADDADEGEAPDADDDGAGGSRASRLVAGLGAAAAGAGMVAARGIELARG